MLLIAYLLPRVRGFGIIDRKKALTHHRNRHSHETGPITSSSVNTGLQSPSVSITIRSNYHLEIPLLGNVSLHSPLEQEYIV